MPSDIYFGNRISNHTHIFSAHEYSDKSVSSSSPGGAQYEVLDNDDTVLRYEYNRDADGMHIRNVSGVDQVVSFVYAGRYNIPRSTTAFYKTRGQFYRLVIFCNPEDTEAQQKCKDAGYAVYKTDTLGVDYAFKAYESEKVNDSTLVEKTKPILIPARTEIAIKGYADHMTASSSLSSKYVCFIECFKE